MAIDRAFSVTLGGTQNVSAHTGKGASTSTPAGDVYLAWDSSKVKNLTDLRHAFLALIQGPAGGAIRDV